MCQNFPWPAVATMDFFGPKITPIIPHLFLGRWDGGRNEDKHPKKGTKVGDAYWTSRMLASRTMETNASSAVTFGKLLHEALEYLNCILERISEKHGSLAKSSVIRIQVDIIFISISHKTCMYIVNIYQHPPMGGV